MSKGNAPRFWALDGYEGLEILDERGLEDFLSVNIDTLGVDERRIIRGLEPGVAFKDGGGASPEWSIRRMTDEECAEGGF